MWIIYAVRVLQIGSILLGLLGGGNALATGSKMFGDVAPTGFDWVATIAPMLAAAATWAGSHFLGWKLTTPAITELIAAAVAYGRNRSDENKMRLLISLVAVAKELVGSLDNLTTLAKAMDTVSTKPIAFPSAPKVV